MNNLLRANIYRLWKSKLFWIVIGFLFFAGGFLVLQQYRQLIGYGIHVKLDNTFFTYPRMIGVIASVFCSLFLGAEYGDGTMRNKLIGGYQRWTVYFANLLTSIIACFLFCAVYMLSCLLFGIPLLGTFAMPLRKVLLLILGSLVSVVAMCSFFTMVSMLIQTKAIAPVVCIVAMFFSVLVLGEVEQSLEQPKYYYDGDYNHAYVDGTQREILTFIYDAIPEGQELQYAGRKTEKTENLCLYAAGLTVFTTAAGGYFFKKKDMK